MSDFVPSPLPVANALVRRRLYRQTIRNACTAPAAAGCIRRRKGEDESASNPQNRKYITHSTVVTGALSHGHGSILAQKFHEVWTRTAATRGR